MEYIGKYKNISFLMIVNQQMLILQFQQLKVIKIYSGF